MTLDQARCKANQLARQTGVTAYVVFDPTYRDEEDDQAYHVATEEDVDTFFAGATVVCAANGV